VVFRKKSTEKEKEIEHKYGSFFKSMGKSALLLPKFLFFMPSGIQYFRSGMKAINEMDYKYNSGESLDDKVEETETLEKIDESKSAEEFRIFGPSDKGYLMGSVPGGAAIGFNMGTVFEAFSNHPELYIIPVITNTISMIKEIHRRKKYPDASDRFKSFAKRY